MKEEATKRWEYRIIDEVPENPVPGYDFDPADPYKLNRERLNDMGDQGWELVGPLNAGGGALVMKREKS